MLAAQPRGGADAEKIAVFREGIGITNLGGDFIKSIEFLPSTFDLPAMP